MYLSLDKGLQAPQRAMKIVNVMCGAYAINIKNTPLSQQPACYHSNLYFHPKTFSSSAPKTSKIPIISSHVCRWWKIILSYSLHPSIPTLAEIVMTHSMCSNIYPMCSNTFFVSTGQVLPVRKQLRKGRTENFVQGFLTLETRLLSPWAR